MPLYAGHYGNTTFKHKLAHITTWTAPYRKYSSAKDENGNPKLLLGPDGLPRRNPFRHQIDFIATRTKHRRFVKNARSYGGIKTNTDHKLVKATIKFEWSRLKNKKPATIKTDTSKFGYKDKQTEYQIHVANKFSPPSSKTTAQEHWNNIVETCLQSGKEVLGEKSRKHVHNCPELQQLSDRSHEIHKQIEATNNTEHEQSLRLERKNVIKKIRKVRAEDEKHQFEDSMKELETTKDDSNRYYTILREVNRVKSKDPICVYNLRAQMHKKPN